MGRFNGKGKAILSVKNEHLGKAFQAVKSKIRLISELVGYIRRQSYGLSEEEHKAVKDVVSYWRLISGV
jgi:hypothetical protein